MKIEKILKKHDLKTNSKDIKKGDIFVCALGNIDKHKYILDAKKKGCKLVITNKDIKEKVKYFKHDNINLYLNELLKIKYHNPLDKIKLIGVTGTDGKTTTSTIIRYMLDAGSIGTNGVEFKNKKINTLNTTPSLEYLYKYFDMMKHNNIQNVVMEVSSESYLTNRIPGLLFDVGIFLNIGKEHLDKHKSFNNYLACKKEMLLNSKIKIINKDSKYYKDIIKGLDNYLTYGKKKSDLHILKYRLFYDRTIIWIKYLKKKYKIVSPLIGEFNVYSLCASILCLLSLDYNIIDCLERIKKIKVIPGRMEKISENIMIDYAHTEQATLNILKFLSKYSHKKIITVVGCAGDRFKEKRKLIGKYALKYSSYVIFTSDDPRWENPKDIVNEMIDKKKKNYFIILNRSDAVNFALHFMDKYLVLILGKGRDNYMAIGEEKVLYSDIDVINKFLENR